MEFVQPLRKKTEIERVKEALRSRSLRDYALFTLGINSGLRISDLLRLRVEDVMRVGKSGRRSIKGQIEIREKKRRKMRRFPINRESRSALRDYLYRTDLPSEEPLFASRKRGADGARKAISRQQAYSLLVEAARRAGLDERIGTHTLRKTFAFHLHERGVDLTRIQKILGHSRPEETLAYMGITEDEIFGIIEDLCL